MTMLRRIRFKPLLAFNGAVDLLWWHGAFFDDSMRHNCRNRTVEEIQDPAVDTLPAGTQFVDSIPQQIRLRPPQFVTQFAEPFHPQKALRLGFYRQLLDPLQEGACAVIRAVKDDLRLGILSQSIRNLAKTQGRRKCRPITA